MPKFIKDFFDIYAYEDDCPYPSFSNQYNDHIPTLDPVTGKKKISISKIFKRVFALFAFLLFLLVVIIRYIR